MERNNKGYILNIYDKGDNDANIIVLLDNSKIISLLAKGFQKPESKNRASIKISSIVDLEYFQKDEYPNSGLLKRGEYIKGFDPKNQRDLSIVEFIRSLWIKKKSATKNTFKIIEKIMKELNSGFVTFTHIILVIRDFLTSENINLSATSCAICGSTSNIHTFDPRAGGIICKNCATEQNKTVDQELLKKLIVCFGAKDSTFVNTIIFTPGEVEVLREIFMTHLIEDMGVNADSLKDI